MTNTGLHIKDLYDSFGTFSIGPLSMDMHHGEYRVILGPTGCGKTSLLRSLCGISPGTKGTITLNKTDISRLPAHKRRIGYVTQAGDLFPHLTVSQNVAFGLRYTNLTATEKKERINRLLDMFSLRKIADQPAATVSGGEGKRTAMARSLIIEPQLLLLDEPLGMLDHNSRKIMLDILKMIHTDLKTTTIHVTHDRFEAWRAGDSCAVMNSGRIVQSGTVHDLFRAPQSVFVAEFLGGKNVFEASFSGNRADTGFTTFELDMPADESKGYIVIRPERISIASTDDCSGVSATVRQVLDCGDFIEIECDIDAEQSLFVHATYEMYNKVSTGDRIQVTWPRSALHVIAGTQ